MNYTYSGNIDPSNSNQLLSFNGKVILLLQSPAKFTNITIIIIIIITIIVVIIIKIVLYILSNYYY